MIRWENSLSAGLERIGALASDLTGDVMVGAQVILNDSDKRVPKVSGDLLSSGKIAPDRGGKNTVGISYDGPYARWVHEHLHFKHPHGGTSKFLELALLYKGEEAVNEAGEHFWERL